MHRIMLDSLEKRRGTTEIPALFPLSSKVLSASFIEGSYFSNDHYQIAPIQLTLSDTEVPFRLSVVYDTDSGLCSYTHPVQSILTRNPTVLMVYTAQEVLDALQEAFEEKSPACVKVLDELCYEIATKPQNLAWVYKTYHPVLGLGLVVQLERRADLAGVRVYVRTSPHNRTYTLYHTGPSETEAPYTLYCNFAYKLEDAVKAVVKGRKDRLKVFPCPFTP